MVPQRSHPSKPLHNDLYAGQYVQKYFHHSTVILSIERVSCVETLRTARQQFYPGKPFDLGFLENLFLSKMADQYRRAEPLVYHRHLLSRLRVSFSKAFSMLEGYRRK